MKKVSRILAVLLAIAMMLSLAVMTVQAKSEKSVSLTISAAASLKDVMKDITTLYKKEKSNVTLSFNYGASGALQKQIEQGAPADAFISAGAKQMDALKKEKLLDDSTVKNLLLNEVVLIAPKDSKLSVKGFKDVTSDKVKAIALGEPKSVPAGQYAEEIFTNLKILDQVKAKAVYGSDVRQILTWVEQGNADLGVVYKTDALISTKVKVIESASSSWHSPVVYPAAVIKASKSASAAKDFLNFLSGKKAKAAFEKYGFKMAGK